MFSNWQFKSKHDPNTILFLRFVLYRYPSRYITFQVSSKCPFKGHLLLTWNVRAPLSLHNITESCRIHLVLSMLPAIIPTDWHWVSLKADLSTVELFYGRNVRPVSPVSCLLSGHTTLQCPLTTTTVIRVYCSAKSKGSIGLLYK